MVPSSATQHYAAFASALTFGSLSEVAAARAKASILDAVGCILAGSASEEADIVRRAGGADSGAGMVPVLGTDMKLAPVAAALANGTAGHALDYDDSSPPMIGHPSVPIVSALLSLSAGRDISGAELITAYVAGLEIAAGLGRHLNPAHYAAGWHATATLGTLGAALAGARIAGLGEIDTAHALGIAASSAGGVRKNFGSMVKPLHAGLAARNGVLAVQLAAAGFAADPAALDGGNGFVDNFRGDGAMPDWSWGGDLEIQRSGVGIKRYPCCGCTHSALDALLALREEHAPQPGAVAAIHCTMNGLVPDILVHHRPTTPAQAKFSMEYCLAVALLDGACGLDQFDPARVAADDVQDLLRRVATEVDLSIAYRNGVYPGTVTVTLRDGRRLSASREEALGHPDHPLAVADLRHKFTDCAARAIAPEQARDAFAQLASLEELASFRTLIPLLVPQGDQS